MLALEDIKVIDFSQRLPGQYCASLLADFGAEVVLVERADAVPETRNVFPGLFELMNKNKKSITLNLKSGEGVKIACKLMAGADVIIEEFKPGVAARLGVGYKQAKEINPRVIYCSISGFGQDGPYRDRVGHDINYLSLSGILSIPGQPYTPPSRPGVPLVDLTAGMFAALSVAGAVRKRDREGTGEYIDVSMLDCMVSWMSTRAGRQLVYGGKNSAEHLSALNNVYETKDGQKVSLGILEQHFWENFCRALGREELLDDGRFSTAAARKKNIFPLFAVMKETVSRYTRAELDRLLDWEKVPYAPILTMEETLDDPHVQARRLFQEIGAGELGGIKEILFPAVFSGSRIGVKSPPPAWGQHTEEVLKGAGYTGEDVKSFRDVKAI